MIFDAMVRVSVHMQTSAQFTVRQYGLFDIVGDILRYREAGFCQCVGSTRSGISDMRR